MQELQLVGLIYAFLGFIYATYVLVSGLDKWYWFPVNMLFGPIVFVKNFITYKIFKKIPRV